MVEVLICQTIFFLSIFGILVILFRSYPLLVSYKEVPRPSKLKEIKTKVVYLFTSFGERISRRIKILLLKAENKISFLVEFFRKRKIYFLKKKK